MACVGCHGGIGATTDSIFSLPRKLSTGGPAGGWFHWTQHGLSGLREPRRRDGRYEYTLYLEANRAGDELRENAEVLARFFDDQGVLRPAEIARLHADIGTLLMPSRARAIDLDRAYSGHRSGAELYPGPRRRDRPSHSRLRPSSDGKRGDRQGHRAALKKPPHSPAGVAILAPSASRLASLTSETRA